MGKCKICGKEGVNISNVLGYCYQCLRNYWDSIKEEIFSLHAASRQSFGLPPYVAKNPEGIQCRLCVNKCVICWETNGAVNPKILKQMAKISLASGGCIKFDLKAWHEGVHKALCGVSNRQTLENFAWLTSLSKKRPPPPLGK